MPTGYTNGVQSGKITDFKEYAMLCAREFGATIMMREDPLDAEIPEFEPSTFYLDRLNNAKRQLAELEQMTDQERRALYESERRATVRQCRTTIRERQEERSRYESMLQQAKAFQPPTADHQGFAEFMVTQLEESIKWDCDIGYWEQQLENELPLKDWETERKASLRQDIERYQSEWKEEQERTAQRNTWVRQLRESLEMTKVTE